MANMYFGVPGAVKEIPCPDSGLGFDTSSESETTALVSGGQSVWRPATAYRTFDMSWRSNSANLRTLIGMYNGQFGPGPFYMTDPTADQVNVLPARWANSWQLAHQANGWCRPVVEKLAAFPNTPNVNDYFTDRQSSFTQTSLEASTVVRTNLILNPSLEVDAVGHTANAGTGGVGSGARSTGTAGYVGNAFYRYTWTTGTSAASGFLEYNGLNTAGAVTVGTTYSFSVYVRSSRATSIQAVIGWRNGSGAVSSTTGTATAVSANTWTRVTVSGVAPATADRVLLDASVASGGANWVAADTFDWDALLFEAAASPTPYFDGDSANGTSEVYRWSSTAHASSSLALVLDTLAASGKVKTRTIRSPGKSYWFAVDGDTTNGAAIKIRGFSQSGATWTDLQTITVMDGVSRQITGLTSDMTMLELDLYMPLFSTLKLRGMALGTYPAYQPGNVLYTNLATNPSMVTTSGTVTARTNYINNPAAEVDATQWTAENGATFVRDTTSPISGTASFKHSTGGDAYTTVTAASGEYWTLSADYKTSGTVAGTPKLYLVTLGGTPINASTNLPLTQASPGRFSVTLGPLPAGTTNIVPTLFAPTSGGVVWFDNVLLEKSATAGTYFDGSTTASGDYTYAWTGTANASSSIARGLAVVTVTGTNAAAYQGTTWADSGSTSLRVTPTGTSNDSFAAVAYTLQTGKTYTISATVRLAAAQTGSINGVARTLRVLHSGTTVTSTAATNAAGTTRVSVSFTCTDGAQFQSVRLYNGATAGNGDVWWDSLTIMEGSYTGQYFDGSTTASSKQWYYWTGAANASTSVATDHAPSDYMPVGQGVGALQFTDAGKGTLVSTVIDRIGLSMGMTEVQQVERVTYYG